MSTPLVSVIITAYNSACFLAAAIESVLAQTYSHYELIVVDDGSTDGSDAIACAYPAVRLIRQSNQGAPAARNTGIAAAGGELIAFLDADDLWLPGKLAAQVARHNAEPQLGYTLVHQRLFMTEDMSGSSRIRPELMNPHPGYWPSCWMVRAEVFAQIGTLDTNQRYSDDSDWIFRAKDAQIASAILPETLVAKRVHPDNLTGDSALVHTHLLGVVQRSIARQRQQRTTGNDK